MDKKMQKIQSVLQDSFWDSMDQRSALLKVSGVSPNKEGEVSPKEDVLDAKDLFLLREQIATSILLVKVNEKAQLEDVYVLDAMGMVDGAGSSSKKMKNLLAHSGEPISAHLMHCDPQEKSTVIAQLKEQHNQSAAMVRYGNQKSVQWIAIPVEDLLHLKPLGEQYAQKYKSGTIGSLAWFEQLERSLERINKSALEYLEKYHPNSRALELVNEYQLRHDYLHWDDEKNEVGRPVQNNLGFAAVTGSRMGFVYRGQKILHSGVDIKDKVKSTLKMKRPTASSRKEAKEEKAEQALEKSEGVKEKHTLDVIKEYRKEAVKLEKEYEAEKKDLIAINQAEVALSLQEAKDLESERQHEKKMEALEALEPAPNEAAKANVKPEPTMESWLARPSKMWHSFMSFVDKERAEQKAEASPPALTLMERLQAFRHGKLFKQMLESDIEWSDQLPLEPAALPEELEPVYAAQKMNQQERMVQRALELRAMRAQQEGTSLEGPVSTQELQVTDVAPPVRPVRGLPTPRPRFRPW